MLRNRALRTASWLLERDTDGIILGWCLATKFSGGRNVKHLIIRMSLVTLLVVGFVALSNTSAAAQDAAGTYKAKCAMCHGADGKGGKMGTRDFASPEVKAETDAQLTEIITKGKGKMPTYEGKLKDTEIKDLVAYIRGLAKGK